MEDNSEEAFRRLSAISTRAKISGTTLAVHSIVEAVLGKAPDKEVVGLVTAAFESNGINPITEKEMVDGILALSGWLRENA